MRTRVGTPWGQGWGHHKDEDAMGMGTPRGLEWGHHGDRDTMGQ